MESAAGQANESYGLRRAAWTLFAIADSILFIRFGLIPIMTGIAADHINAQIGFLLFAVVVNLLTAWAIVFRIWTSNSRIPLFWVFLLLVSTFCYVASLLFAFAMFAIVSAAMG